jgi:hypothetical protein
MHLSEQLPCRKKIGDIEGGVFIREPNLFPWIVSWETKKSSQPMFNSSGDVVTDEHGAVVVHDVTESLCVCLGSGMFTWIDREELVIHLPNATLTTG